MSHNLPISTDFPLTWFVMGHNNLWVDTITVSLVQIGCRSYSWCGQQVYPVKHHQTSRSSDQSVSVLIKYESIVFHHIVYFSSCFQKHISAKLFSCNLRNFVTILPFIFCLKMDKAPSQLAALTGFSVRLCPEAFYRHL